MKPGKVTVVEWHHMGDAVMALPFIRGALAAGIEVSLCAAPGPAEVFRLAFPTLRLAVMDPKTHAWWQGYEWSPWRLQSGSDTAVCAWADPRVAYWMKQAGFLRRIGLPAKPVNCYAREAALLAPRLKETEWCGQMLERWAGPLLTETWSRPDRQAHHQDNWAALARILGFEINPTLPWLQVPSTPSRAPGDYWVIHPGGRLPWKHWLPEHWETLLAALARRSQRTILVQGPGIPRIDRLPAGHEVFSGGNLADFAALLGSSIGLIGLDSFPAHLATALGKKAVVLFGDMPDCWFAPRGPGVRLVKTESNNTPLRNYRQQQRSLLHTITPAQVLEAISS